MSTDSIRGFDSNGAPGEEGRGRGAPGAEPGVPPTPAAPTAGDLSPLCNTGDNSPKGEETRRDREPARIALGYLKIKHSRESYAVWSACRVRLLLANGAQPCPAHKQHRLFGARLHWGGFEYWGTPRRKNIFGMEDQEDQGVQEDYVLNCTPEEVEALRSQQPSVRLPDGVTAMTEWSDDALHRLDIFLGWEAKEAGGEGKNVLLLLAELLAAGAAVTRIDISADFADTPLDPVDAARLARDFLPMRVEEFHDSRGKKATGGRTCYFGSRGADGGGVFVRFYEKGKEQGLPADLLRYEVEASGDKAQDAARRLAAAPHDWAPIGASILAGAIDFRDGYGTLRGSAHAARDCLRCPWWSLLLERLAAGVKLTRLPRPDPTLVSIREWIERCLGRALAMMKFWMGAPRFTTWLHGIIDQGADRLTQRDLAILRDAQRCDAPF